MGDTESDSDREEGGCAENACAQEVQLLRAPVAD